MTGGGKESEPVEVGVTWETYVELGKPAGITVLPTSGISATDGFVCAPYAFGDPFIMPGNLVRSCSVCGHTVQLRPHTPEGIKLFCVPCALAAGMRMPVLGGVGKARNPNEAGRTPDMARLPGLGRSGIPSKGPRGARKR